MPTTLLRGVLKLVKEGDFCDFDQGQDLKFEKEGPDIWG